MKRPDTKGRSNGNESGNSKARRARRAWLVTPEAGFGGDGVKVLCQVCRDVWVYAEHELTELRMFVGRIIPGHQGGTYRRDNVRPECRRCSCQEGQRTTIAVKKLRLESI